MKKRSLFYALIIVLVPLLYLGCSDDEETQQFNLSVTVSPADGGTVTPASGIFDDGEVVTIAAVPGEGYAFLQWGGDATGTTNPLILTITSDLEITAEFTQQDADGDGVCDNLDQCPNTPTGADVNTNGCALSELDSDGDGITDDQDLCADTPDSEEADETGCSVSQKDTDSDGVADDLDQCPETPEGEDVDEQGCSLSQKDTDGDGVTDDEDLCPGTPEGVEVNSVGCELSGKTTYVPDDNFEQILINLGLDTALDDYVLTNNINSLITLELSSGQEYGVENPLIIADFTGIEDFTALLELAITGMDLSGNVLDLSENQNLKSLYLSCNTLDNLILGDIAIESLYVSGSIYLDDCVSTASNLDLSTLSNLRFLQFFNTQVDNINEVLKTVVSIEHLFIGDVFDRDGPIAYLDVSNNANLTWLEVVSFNSVGPEVINLKNGANDLLWRVSLWVANPNIQWEVCLEADDPSYIQSIVLGDWGPTPTYSVSTDCGG